jgi:glutaryl-CoA dehydrogenase
MARLDKIGPSPSPSPGTDPTPLRWRRLPAGTAVPTCSTARRVGSANGTIADVIVVWARDTSDGKVKGFLVEKGTPGYQACVIEGKASLRAVWQAEIVLEGVRVPAENLLPGANSFADCATVLVGTRSACAWMALGHAVAGFDAALAYAKRRTQFGKTLASFQIVQQRPVQMLAEVIAMQLYCVQIARLAEAGRLAPTLAGLAKLHTTTKAEVCLPRPGTCSAATASCWTSTPSGTWPTSRRYIPSRAPRPSRR